MANDHLRHEKVAQVDVTPLFAEAILRMHEGGSLTELMEHGLQKV